MVLAKSHCVRRSGLEMSPPVHGIKVYEDLGMKNGDEESNALGSTKASSFMISSETEYVPLSSITRGGYCLFTYYAS